jgi:integrase
MAFGYRRPDSSAWWVRYKGVADPATGERRSVAEACPPQVTSKEIADEYAQMRELQAKLVVGVREIGEVATVARTIVAMGEVTVLEAARRHPATRREEQSNPRDARRHKKEVSDFTRATGATLLSQVTLDEVLDYITHMRRKGMSYSSRRHALSWIKRACAMAPSYGLLDVLADMRLDRNEGGSVVAESLELDVVATKLDEMLSLEDRRVAAVVALGATCGLRPTEICRIRVGDVDQTQQSIQIGAVAFKNRASVRLLPVPPFVLAIIAPLLDRSEDSPLITNGVVGKRHIDIYKLSHLISPALGAPPKILRKSFTTIAALELDVDERIVEGMLGHAYSGFAQVTRRHYLAKARIEKLRAVADAMESGFSAIAQKKKLSKLVTFVGLSVVDA